MRLIDANKLYPDCLTKTGRLAISQSQIAEAPTVELNRVKDELNNELSEKIETYKNSYRIMSDAFENEVRKKQIKR